MKRLSFASLNLVEFEDHPKESNELRRFYNNNRSSVANIVVYLFWIIASILFAEEKIDKNSKKTLQNDLVKEGTLPADIIEEIR